MLFERLLPKQRCVLERYPLKHKQLLNFSFALLLSETMTKKKYGLIL